VTSQVRTFAVTLDLLVWFLSRSRIKEKFSATRTWKMQLDGYEQLRLIKERGPHNEDKNWREIDILTGEWAVKFFLSFR
jgi:hypothetical protein